MIQFRHRINEIKTHKFETFSFNEGAIDKVGLTMQINFTKKGSHLIDVIGIFKFSIENGKNPILHVSTGITFDILPEDFDALVQDDGAMLVPHEVAVYLAGLMFGCARGILSVRTENTKFSQFIIPPIDVTTIIQGDVKIIQANTVNV